MRREDNGGPDKGIAIEVFAIGQPEVDDHPPALPYPPVMEKTLLPPAIAHLTVGGNSLNLSTETG